MYTKFNSPKSCPRTVYRYGNVDFNCLRNALSYTPWDLVLDSSTINFQDLVIARNQGHSSPLTIISGISYYTLRNNRISREFNMAAITARSAKKSVSYHDLYNLNTADLLFDEKKNKRRPASKSLGFFEAER